MGYGKTPADVSVSATAVSCDFVDQGQALECHFCRSGRPHLPSRAGAGTDLKLRRLTLQVTQRFESELRKAGVTTPQALLLSQIAAFEPVGLGVLARVMGIAVSTLTRNLKLAVDAGWVVLAAGNDGRSRNAALTGAGRSKLEAACPRWDTAQQSIDDLLGPQRITALHSLLDECLNIMCSRAGAPTESGEPQDTIHLKEMK